MKVGILGRMAIWSFWWIIGESSFLGTSSVTTEVSAVSSMLVCIIIGRLYDEASASVVPSMDLSLPDPRYKSIFHPHRMLQSFLYGISSALVSVFAIM